MCIQKKFWEIQQCFEKIRLLCVKKCAMISKNDVNQVAFFEAIVRYCAFVFSDVEQFYADEIKKEEKYQNLAENAYFNGCSYKEVQQDLLKMAQKEEKIAIKKENINEAVCEGYKALPFFMMQAVDYPLYEQKTKFGMWNKEENPYALLQNIGKKTAKKKRSFFETAQLFQQILAVLSKKVPIESTMEDINKLIFEN